ncbi:hypothetical protein [Bradyrhizobium sp. DOA9]|uniref:hypothetical protein n=1 Tax=Bradyrhizobium sp. DOA9 TaxID=1126627 RepID=UPI000468645B|nr:hypothetical protein [Bradyrhizobium sp. DOA9]
MTTAPAVTVAIEAHSIDPNLHRALAEQIPRSGQLAEVEACSHEIHALAAFMCVSTIEAIAHNMVLNEEIRSEKMVTVLVDETTWMGGQTKAVRLPSFSR